MPSTVVRLILRIFAPLRQIQPADHMPSDFYKEAGSRGHQGTLRSLRRGARWQLQRRGVRVPLSAQLATEASQPGIGLQITGEPPRMIGDTA